MRTIKKLHGAYKQTEASRRSVFTLPQKESKSVDNQGKTMSASESIERLLTPAEVEEILGVPLKTLYRWSHLRHCGMPAGPEVLRVGGRLRYRPDAIRDYLKSAAS